MYYNFGRDIRLEILATISASNETLAYVFHRSKDPELREMADDLMDNSNQIKRLFKDKLTGVERDLYLLKAEGDYIPPEDPK